MPNYLRHGVLEVIESIFNDTMPLKTVDSRNEWDSGIFQALHLNYYNRYSEKVSLPATI